MILLDRAKYHTNFLGSSMTLAMQVPHDLVKKSAWCCNIVSGTKSRLTDDDTRKTHEYSGQV